MKKISAFLLVGVMLLVLCGSALADEVIIEDNNDLDGGVVEGDFKPSPPPDAVLDLQEYGWSYKDVGSAPGTYSVPHQYQTIQITSNDNPGEIKPAWNDKRDRTEK